MFNNKFDQSRPEVCPEIEKIFIRHIASSSTFFYQAYTIVDLFLFWNFLEHIFEHINTPLSGLFWKTEKCSFEE